MKTLKNTLTILLITFITINVNAQIDNSLPLSLNTNSLFKTGNADLKDEGITTLKGIAEQINSINDGTIIIEGHTDDMGSSNSNQILSERRANSVADLLKINVNSSSFKWKVIGYGENKPKVKNSTSENRKTNRRIDIYVNTKSKITIDVETKPSTQSSSNKLQQKKGCISGNCENGFGKFVLNNSKYYYNYYEGNFKNGERNGKGTLVKNTYSSYDKKFTESLRYVGQFKNGQYHGKGKEIGTLLEYEGNWKEGKKDGYGIGNLGSISVYKGNWLNDKKVGKGKETFSNGNSFEGEYKDNEFHKGTYFYKKSSQKYIGEFKNSKRHGYGKYYLKDGSLYFEGQFIDGKPVKK